MRIDILLVAKRIFGLPEGFYWLFRVEKELGPVPPIVMAITKEGANRVMDYLRNKEYFRRYGNM